MATTNFNATTSKPFAWYDHQEFAGKTIAADPVMRTLSEFRDHSSGIVTILQLIESNWLAKFTNDTKPMLDDAQVSSLLRMAIAAAQSIEEQADSSMEWATEHKQG